MLRQGENLSPLLYAIYINELSSKLGTNTTGLSYLNNLAQNMDITTCNIYSKLFLLLYADDTVILAENQSELQKTLEILHEYCITNELAINTTKTRVMVCSCGKIRNKPTFTYGVNKLEIVFEYMYLGVKVTYNGKFKDHMEYASLKGTKSMFALLQKANRPCSSRRKIREKRREDALLATSNIARLVTQINGN